MPLYIVSDFREAHIGPSRVWHWRTMGVFNRLPDAKAWAGPESIITTHTETEALAIHATRILPDAALSHQIAA
jgi:hypothetical protein